MENRWEPSEVAVRWHTVVVGIGKIFQKKYFLVGIAFNEHGGKTGRAMIKYPLYKKNNSRKYTLLYPVSVDAPYGHCDPDHFYHYGTRVWPVVQRVQYQQGSR